MCYDYKSLVGADVMFTTKVPIYVIAKFDNMGCCVCDKSMCHCLFICYHCYVLCMSEILQCLLCTKVPVHINDKRVCYCYPCYLICVSVTCNNMGLVGGAAVFVTKVRINLRAKN